MGDINIKIFWIIIYLTALAWSAYMPKDYFTWFLEVVPSLIGVCVLGLTFKKFPLTPLLYVLILIHSIILMIGGHYTYAEVPIPEIFSGWFEDGRNNFDKLGHLAQGFVPAIIAREILIRKQVMHTTKWLNVVVVSFCLSFSALYELLEWLVAELTGENAEAFLGTQGYVWDTQTDMLMALVGAILSLITLSKLHNRQLSTRGFSPIPITIG